MKMTIAVAAFAAVLVATPAAAGYRYVTVDGPADPIRQATIVTGINDAGLAAGYKVDSDGVGGPGLYTGFTVNADGSGYTSYVRPGSIATGFAGINNAGDIAGVSISPTFAGTGFVRSGTTGAYTDITPTFAGAYYSEAIGINNAGSVTGYYITDPAATVATLTQYAHGYVETGGVFTAVDVDPGTGYGTQVVSINDFGFLTASYYGATDNLMHAAYGYYDAASHTAGIIPYADPFGAASNSLGTVNDLNQLAYDSVYPTPLSPIGFVSAAYVLDPLHHAATPIAVPGGLFTNAYAINNVGQVTGFYAAGTTLHGFIATAVPEPAAWALMVAGFGLVGGVSRRRPASVAA